jgi:hypothetical protein
MYASFLCALHTFDTFNPPQSDELAQKIAEYRELGMDAAVLELEARYADLQNVLEEELRVRAQGLDQVSKYACWISCTYTMESATFSAPI